MNMLKPLQRIYLFIALLALLITGIFHIVFFSHISPFQFSILNSKRYKIPQSMYTHFLSLDSTGLDYRIVIVNDRFRKEYYLKIYLPDKGTIIDQYNFHGILMEDRPASYDFTGDGVNEIVVFSNDDEWIYLSAIDVVKNRMVFRERPIVHASPKKARPHWDINYYYPVVTDLEGDGKDELIFNINSGYSLFPRELLALSLPELEIIHRFPHHMGYVKPVVVDLDEDGKKEIALGNVATNNFSPDSTLSDAFTWKIILNHQFEPIKPPKIFGQKFSAIHYFPLQIKNKPYLLMYCRPELPQSQLMLYHSDYSIEIKKTFPFQLISVYINEQDSLFPIIATNKKQLIYLDSRLQIAQSFSFSPSMNRMLIFAQLPLEENTKYYLCGVNNKGLYLLNKEAEQVTFISLPVIGSNQSAQLIHINSSPHPVFFVKTRNARYQISLISNPLYRYRIFGEIFLFLFLIALLTVGHWTLNQIWRYVSYFVHSLHHSDHAIILLDHKGRIVSVNRKLNQLLSLKKPLQRTSHYYHSLSDRPEIVEAIQECANTGKKVNRMFSFELPDKSFFGEVTITPFRSYFNFINTFLVEIKDSTREVLLERQQNWQRNLRKIIHDIKTPLAGVQLQLQALYMNIVEKYPEMENEVLDKLEKAHKELFRIYNITKDFLKYTKLNQIQLDRIPLKEFIRECLHPFRIHFSDDFHIESQIHPTTPQFVWWDKRQIELLLHILIENSLDALQGKGKIEVTVQPFTSSPANGKKWIEIRISDNGPGIPPEFRDKIFEPNFSTKKEGSGLGLSFARQIVLLHGGTIEFFSVVSSGTVFVVKLPQMANLKNK